jgi:histidine triad (HIT) family protein
MGDCPFCAFAGGRRNVEPEDFRWLENTMAFTPLRPFAPGHTLVAPLRHHESILDVDPDTLSEVMSDAAELGQWFVDGGADGVNILTSAGEAATQTVMHWHVHVIPRHNGDDLGRWPWEPLYRVVPKTEETQSDD